MIRVWIKSTVPTDHFQGADVDIQAWMTLLKRICLH